MKKFGRLTAGLGAAFLMAGFLLLKLHSSPQGIMQALPYVLLGLGCGAFGYGLGDMVKHKVTESDPQLQRQLEIDTKDERNIAISNRAKAKAYDRMLYVFSALMIAFALMDVALAVVLLLLFAYLFVVGCFIFYLNKYQKEM